MPEDYTIPPPGLYGTDIINLGHIIEPRFTDAHDWGEFITPVETSPVDFEPLDPRLSEEQARSAVELALDRVSGELDGKRFEVMPVALRSLDRRTEHPLVAVYNYTDDIVVEILVDLTENTVMEVESKRYQPPLTAAEESRALDLVRREGRLADNGIDVDTGAGIIVEETDFRSHRSGHRLVDLRFGPLDRRVAAAFAIVDLTSEEVVETGLVPEVSP